MSGVVYAPEPDLSAGEFRHILQVSTLGARRPVEDLPRLDKMLRHASLIITARHDGELIGVARSMTDFSYCCYLSDLAVDAGWQRQGIGRRLIEETKKAAGPEATLILLAAPAAQDYYGKIGMSAANNCWTLAREK